MENFKAIDLWPDDAALFSKLAATYKTDNEKEFFEKMKHKQEYEYTSANDVVFLEDSNADGIYLIRVDNDEYLLGKISEQSKIKEYHFQSLSKVLHSNLKELGLAKCNKTLLEWLQERDYKNVVYDQNYDE